LDVNFALCCVSERIAAKYIYNLCGNEEVEHFRNFRLY